MMHHLPKNQERGMIMLMVVIFFLLISMAIVLGIANPILKNARTAEENLKSVGSYFAAESAVEDIYYRLQASTAISQSESLSLNGGQVTITTTDTITGKQILAEGEVGDNVRKLQATVARGAGVVFKYGTQSGQGGVELENNSVLIGTLYANGNIIGSNGAKITGDAFVAQPTGLIDNVDIGTTGVGNAYAYEVRDSTIQGNLFCKTGSGNDKACNTNFPIPEQLPLPITEEMIAQWKADALVGGIHSGPLTVNSATTIGPKKVEGTLTINGALTLSNTIHATGNIIINGRVKLSPVYGASSGVIIADGYIDINNGVIFEDSGTAGSYILFLSTSNCDASMTGAPCNGNYAIDVGNNSNISIVNAQNGTVYFSNNSSVKESVGNKIRLKNNSTISYGTGVFSTNFSSGPAGGYNITYLDEVQ